MTPPIVIPSTLWHFIHNTKLFRHWHTAFFWTVLNMVINHWHLSLSFQTSSQTQDKLWLSSDAPHLPPIWSLEQTWWVRGRIAHSSLRIVEVLVVATKSVRWFSHPEGTHRPGWGWLSPSRGSLRRTCLWLSHLDFQMKGVFKRQKPFDCLLTVLLLFVLNNCALKAQRDNWAQAIPLDMQP